MIKILVLGCAGMAGHVMAEYLAQKPKYKIIRSARNSITPETIALDVTDFSLLEDVIREQSPDVVVNCVGMLVQASQDHVDQAILINSYLPHFLSRLGSKLDFKLVHISTDCVFSGKRGAYSENDFRDGDTAYARTKAMGEVINDKDLTLRTSIIGPELKRNGTGLLHWFLIQRGTIEGYSNVYWSGVSTLELAKVVDKCVKQKMVGLINISMKRKISKFDLLLEFQKIWDHYQVDILPDDNYASDKSLASRRTDLPFILPFNYSEMLKELKYFMIMHRDFYPHYQ
ncbi:dTDP-4-dehydrorhamnose reductase family protein [Thermodesulfobacteriota bacterium]